MDDSIFAKLGYDPVRIHAHFHGPPAPGGIVRLGGRAAAGEPPPAEDAPLAASLPDPPSPPGVEGEAENPPLLSESKDGEELGAASPRGEETQEESMEENPAAGGESQVERIRLMRAWVSEHFETVEAMARAGEAPQRPAPPPEPAEAAPAEPPPKPYVARGDRWNKPKMAEFLRQLAATHSVSAAAKAVGLSRRSAYKLRARLKGQPFDIAWEAAFRHGYDSLAHSALELALEGEEVPHYYQGQLVGKHRRRNPQLVIGLLRMTNREGAPMLGRYNAAAEYWSENWEQFTHRIETGSVTWDDERRELGEAGLAKLDLPDEKCKVDRIIERNWPDEPPKRR